MTLCTLNIFLIYTYFRTILDLRFEHYSNRSSLKFSNNIKENEYPLNKTVRKCEFLEKIIMTHKPYVKLQTHIGQCNVS